ncbi:flagellar hook-associated protein 2 [Modicisalibacter muralis]|uniref:Flagellar hook-associated protein 2 n=1 Tax=Modicisalibacter muralis TaxID=119000 RepID=A0A1G9FXT7_9GAMM|nr:flagellar filament capping protein FliD [Halomonas muralis]SDK93214.1 flagellar hook-associated protein 2 [Halomonas muralis]
MASISSLGIGSGLDLNGLLDQLETAERKQLIPIVSQQKSYEAKISAFGKLESALDAFKEAAAKLASVDGFQAVSSTVSGESFTVSSGTDAVPGRYEIEITQLARAQSLASNGVADQEAQLGAGNLTITVGTGGEAQTLDIAIADEDSSLEAIRDAINAENGGVTASIINDGSGTPYRLVLTSDKTGEASTMTVNATGNTQLSDLLTHNADGTGTMTETVTAQNAELTVNGIDIVSESNRVEGALQDVTLNLNELTETGSPEILTVSRDTEQISDDIKAFVDTYNSLQKTMDELTAFNGPDAASGVLLGNNTMSSVESQLRAVMGGSVQEGSLNMLSEIGVELTLDGTLELDEERLEELVNDDLDSLSAFFSGGAEGEGLADRLDTTLTGMLEEGGLLSTTTSGLETTIESLDERYARVEESIGVTVERYRVQFAEMDMLVAQMNSTMSYLSQQFDAMNAQLGRG